ncbi:MAG: ATP-binding protein [Ignavibacteria bacterium]
MDSIERLSKGVALVPSGEVSGSMLIGLIRAFRHIQLISGDRAVNLTRGIESSAWYPMAECFRLIGDLCRHDIDYGPILFQAGRAVVEDWFSNGPGQGTRPTWLEFLNMQADSGGYYAVHRGRPDEIGWMDLLELDEAAGYARLESVTPYPVEFERGILYGGARLAGDVEYVRIEAAEEPYNRHLSRKTLTVRFSQANQALSAQLDRFIGSVEPGRAIDADASLLRAMAWRLKSAEEQLHIERRFHQQSALLLEKATKELEEAKLSKERLFAAASHDLRQPIQAMGLFLDALGTADSAQERERHAGSIRIALNALRELLDALLDLAKLDSGTIRPSPAAVPVDELFAEVDATFSPVALSKGLRLAMHFPGRPLSLHVDRRLLLCVLNNLVSNALKNTQRGGVLIALRPRDGGYAFEIWDTGCGIAPEHLDRIFDEYYQVGNPERDRNKGLGLGLAITHRICHLLELPLRCRSRVGRGTVFEVRLPASMRSGVAARPARDFSAPIDASTFLGKRLVLVEDDALVASALLEALAPYGVSIRRFRDAETALADRDIGTADHFIVDHQLAGRMNGLDFLRAVSASRGEAVKGVMISGNTSPEFVGSARQLPWPLLFKPVNTAEILRELAR